MDFVKFLEMYFKSIIALAIALIVLFWLLDLFKKVPVVGGVAGKVSELASGQAYQ